MSARNMAKRTAAGTLALAVCLTGGAVALAGAAQADANFKFDTRVAGDDRYQTAIAASKLAFDKADNVVLVNGFATVDGLTASYLAGVANAPILYVSDKGADADTKAEIKRLGAKNVWLVGGTTVIPTSVETAIKGDGYSVTRINGSDRYETAKLVAEAGAKIAGKQPSKVFVASGTSFADALAVSPIAYAKGYAIALTEKDSTSDYTKKELGNIGSDAKILVGGTAVVSDKVKADLSITTRVAGDDRAVTANLVSDWAKKSEGFNPANAALVGGTNGNGADSLVASALGAKSLTTLHFAGWDATYTYLKDHSAELTGKGFVFGGKAAVPGDQVDKAQAAVQAVAAAQSFIVTDVTNKADGTFKYADPASKKSVAQKFTSDDTYLVDGQAASIGAFRGSLDKGDRVELVISGGKAKINLINKTAKDYLQGLVGNVDLTATSEDVDILEPVTGTALYNIDITPDFALYTVDGKSATFTAFKASINEGDKLEIQGGDGSTASKTRTFALTNQSVAGSVASRSGSTSAPGFTVATAAGAVLGDIPASGTDTDFVAVTGDSITVDGKTASLTELYNATSAGDSITYSRADDKQTIALVNAAPSAISGVYKSISTSTVTYYTGVGSTTSTVNIATGYTYKVNGSVVSLDEFKKAATAGDEVVLQEADTDTNVAASISLNDKNLSGKVASISSTTLGINFADTSDTLASVDYSTNKIFDGNTAATFYVNDTSKTQAQFTQELSLVSNGSKSATISIVDNGATTEFRLSTSANTTSAKVSSVVKAAGSSQTTLTVKFDKPVYLADTAAAGDFVITNDFGGTPATIVYSDATPKTLAGATDTVTLTIASSTFVATKVVKVELTTGGAAKFLDASGKAATASEATGTVTV